MSKEKLNKSFEMMTPSNKQKEKMLKHILSEVNEESQSSVKVITFKSNKNLKYITAIAACLIGIIMSTKVFKQYTTPELPQGQDPSFNSPMEFHNHLYYQGNRYEEIRLIDPQTTVLTQSLGQINEIIKSDKEIVSKQFASTVGLGGTLWELEDVPKEKQIVLEHDGIFYLFEKVQEEKK